MDDQLTRKIMHKRRNPVVKRVKNRTMSVLRTAVPMMMVLFLVGCGAVAAPQLPDNSPGLTTPEEYSFGSDTQGKDWRATRTVLDALERRFGEKSIRQFARDLDETADPAAIKAFYISKLPGWTELALEKDLHGQSWSFALVSPDERYAFAVIALTPQTTGDVGKVPMSVLTNLDAD